MLRARIDTGAIKYIYLHQYLCDDLKIKEKQTEKYYRAFHFIKNKFLHFKHIELGYIFFLKRGNNLCKLLLSISGHIWMDTELFPLSDLPEDCLLHVLSFLPGKDLLMVYSTVNLTWKSLIESQTLWHKKCERLKILFDGLVHESFDFKEYYFKNPYTRNLLKNAKALDGVKYWSLTALGDYYRNETMFIKEETQAGADPLENYIGKHYGDVKNWVTSYIYSSREQTVDLLQEGCHTYILDKVRPPLIISEWYAPRFDCGSEYDVEVKLFAENKKELLDSFQFNCNLNAGRCWFQIKHVFDAYPPGVRFVHFRHGGKDRKFWAGHYGVKMALPTVQFNIEDM